MLGRLAEVVVVAVGEACLRLEVEVKLLVAVDGVPFDVESTALTAMWLRVLKIVPHQSGESPCEV